MHFEHKATIGEDGNIILPLAVARTDSETYEEEMSPNTWYSVLQEEDIVPENSSAIFPEKETEDVETYFELSQYNDDSLAPTHNLSPELTRAQKRVWENVRKEIFAITSIVTEEAGAQFTETFQDAVLLQQSVRKETKKGLSAFIGFLRQPVWVPNKRQKPVQRSRGTLFLLDTVRFGGTFAGLFSFLFITLNYQSFWAIAGSYIAPFSALTGIAANSDTLDERIAEKLQHIPLLSVAGSDDGLIGHLPTVGPPDNRLVIPSLNLNVPIVIPPNDALLREDWTALESVIQESLQDGVVHYPGTARPGQAGNFFVTGHSSYFPWAPGEFKSVFARLHELNVGDEYWVFYNGDRHRYVVQTKKEVKPSDVSVLNQPPQERISTLMTCTPIGTSLRRLIITAAEVDPVNGKVLEVGQRGTEVQTPTLNVDTLPI